MRKLMVPLSGQAEDAAQSNEDIAALSAAFGLGRALACHVEVFCVQAPRPEDMAALPAWVPGSAANDVFALIARTDERRRLQAKAIF